MNKISNVKYQFEVCGKVYIVNNIQEANDVYLTLVKLKYPHLNVKTIEYRDNYYFQQFFYNGQTLIKLDEDYKESEATFYFLRAYDHNKMMCSETIVEKIKG
jgi:hypothetical protein